MQTNPQSAKEWFRSFFISVVCVSALFTLAAHVYTPKYFDLPIWEDIIFCGEAPTVLLLASSLICFFVKTCRWLGILGLLITAFDMWAISSCYSGSALVF